MHATTANHPKAVYSVIYVCLYVLLTLLIPTPTETTTATFANDTVLLSSHEDPHETSTTLQRNLNIMEK